MVPNRATHHIFSKNETHLFYNVKIKNLSRYIENILSINIHISWNMFALMSNCGLWLGYLFANWQAAMNFALEVIQ